MTTSRDQAARTTAPAPERRSFSHRVVFSGLVLSLVFALAVAGYIYFRYVRYERVAAQHVPAGSVAALRVDLEKVVLYEPFRAHFLPLLEEQQTKAPDPGTRLERIKRYTGVELGVDTREIVLSTGPGPADWALLVGGMFRAGAVVPGIERMMQDEQRPFARSADGMVLVAPGGIALAQASDGVVVIASSEARARAALPPGGVHQQLGLSEEGPGGFAITGSGLRSFVPSALLALVPGLSTLNDVARVRGDLALAQDVTLQTTVELTRGTGEEAARQVESLLGGVQAAARLPLAGGVFGGAADFASRVRVTPGPGASATLEGVWSRAEVDRAAAQVAAFLRQAFGWR